MVNLPKSRPAFSSLALASPVTGATLWAAAPRSASIGWIRPDQAFGDNQFGEAHTLSQLANLSFACREAFSAGTPVLKGIQDGGRKGVLDVVVVLETPGTKEQQTFAHPLLGDSGPSS